jgi:hypothetical protein
VTIARRRALDHPAQVAEVLADVQLARREGQEGRDRAQPHRAVEDGQHVGVVLQDHEHDALVRRAGLRERRRELPRAPLQRAVALLVGRPIRVQVAGVQLVRHLCRPPAQVLDDRARFSHGPTVSGPVAGAVR